MKTCVACGEPRTRTKYCDVCAKIGYIEEIKHVSEQITYGHRQVYEDCPNDPRID